MLTKRLIACFDVKNGYVTKARRFENNIEIDLAGAVAQKIYDEQIDEIIFYDITASAEKRKTDLNTVREVASRVFVPFTVGGGIRTAEDMYDVLAAGAEKVSVDSMAVRNPAIITEGAKAFGSQCVVLSMQVKRVEKTAAIPSGYEIAIDGARVFTGMDAIE
ncbi:MAG: tRNA-dihydrouridine synthase, partial [Clostridia bacterium]|nr:tRNA-dihydrouridine synthase [Clostridia bacterium]